MQDMNKFDETNAFHVECLRYCFMQVIQADIDRIAEHWNSHEIRQQMQSIIPSGKPELLYYVPEIFRRRDYGYCIELDDVEKSNRKAMHKNWTNQKANPALKTKREINKYYK